MSNSAMQQQETLVQNDVQQNRMQEATVNDDKPKNDDMAPTDGTEKLITGEEAGTC